MKHATTLILESATAALLLVVCNQPITVNNPPDPPSTPEGPATGRADSTYTFTTAATDPDADSVCVRFDWGDGDTSDWGSLVASGEAVSMEHQWYSGTYSVSAQAKDAGGILSDWSDVLSISIRPWPPYPTEWIGTVCMFDGNEDMVASPDGQFVYVLVDRGLCPIRTRDNSIAAIVRFPDTEVWRIGVSPDGEYILIAGDRLLVLSARTYRLLPLLDLTPHLRDVCAPANCDYFYCAIQDTIVALRTHGREVAARIPVGADPQRLTATPDGRYLYARCSDRVLVIDAAANKVVDTVMADARGDADMVVLPQGDYLYIAGASHCLYVLRTSDNTIVDTVPVHGYVEHLTVTPDGSYVLGTCDTDVNVVDTHTRSVVDTIEFPGCECYHPIALLPDGSRFYVATHEQVHIFGHQGTVACPGRDRQSPCE